MKPRARGRAAAPASLPGTAEETGERGGKGRGDKNKNTVSLVSKAGDVLTPVGDGDSGRGGTGP